MAKINELEVEQGSVKKNQIIILTSGVYDGYGLEGTYIATCDFNIANVVAEYYEYTQYNCNESHYQYSHNSFLGWLLTDERYLKPVASINWWIGDYNNDTQYLEILTCD